MPPPLPPVQRTGVDSSLKITPPYQPSPRSHCRVGLHIVLFEACSAFTHVAAYTLARSPLYATAVRETGHFVTSMPAPVASGWSGCRAGLAPAGEAPPFHGARGERSFAAPKQALAPDYLPSYLVAIRQQVPSWPDEKSGDYDGLLDITRRGGKDGA